MTESDPTDQPAHREQPTTPASLAVQLLGGFSLRSGERVVLDDTWHEPFARALLALLALAPGHAATRDAVARALWPDTAAEAGAADVAQTVEVARQALAAGDQDAAGVLHLTDDGVALVAPGGVRCDAAGFEEAANRARQSDRIADYRSAIAAYRGDFLPTDRDLDWTNGTREHLRELYLLLHVELADCLREEGNVAAAVEVWHQLVSLEPTHEVAHVALMRHLAASGRRAPALRQYARLREALLRERGTEPAPESQRLYAALLSGQFGAAQVPQDEAEQPSAPPQATNLPPVLSSFVGRRREIAELTPLLAPATAPSRLVTLTGPGGTGKTRLALETVRQLPPHHRDGTWLVDLASVDDSERVADTVARAVGVREEAGTPLLTTLRTALAPKVALIVLDNCEHLRESCAALAGALLRACSHLYLLATSREALRVPGELVWRVPPLAIAPAAASANESDAVSLLVERVRLHDPHFAVTGANAAAITAICQRLDGLPLALELVAGQMSALSPEAVAARLDNALALLVGGDDALAARQQTLRSTLDWSHALLTPAEARLFQRLAIFVGGWSLAAAEAVCADPATATTAPLPTGAILDVLARLVEQSLVVVTRIGEQTRYRFLEPVRQYAAEYLRASGELTEIGARHAAYMVALVERGQRDQAGRNQGMVLATLAREEGNLRAGLRWCLTQRDLDLGWRLGRHLWRFWLGRGQISEGRSWLTALLALDETPSGARAELLQGAAAMHTAFGDSASAIRYHEEAITIQRALGDTRGLAGTLNNLGLLYLRNEGDYERASIFFQEALELNRGDDNQRWYAINLNNLGVVAEQQGDLHRALALQEESLGIFRELQLEVEANMVLADLGDALRALGYDAKAEAVYRQTLAFQRATGARFWQGRAALGLGGCLLSQGDYAGARAALAEALLIFHTIQAVPIAIGCLDQIAGLLVATGEPVAALRLASATTANYRQTGRRRLPTQERHIERVTAQARAMLPDDVAAATWEAGQHVSIAEVSAEALRLLADEASAED